VSNLRIDQIPAICVRWHDALPAKKGGQLQLDDNLKHLIKELGAAINDALSESKGINDAIQNVKDAGYDVFLVLEATIGFNKKPMDSVEDAAGVTEAESAQLKVTGQDLKFLRSLKISVEDLDVP